MENIYNFLGSIRRLRRKKERLYNKVKELRASLLPCGITYDKDKVDTSPRDTFSDTFAELSEAEDELELCINQIAQAEVAIIRGTLPLPDKERTMVVGYYVRLKSIRRLAEQLNVTERHAYRLKENGVSMLAKLKEMQDDTINNNSLL